MRARHRRVLQDHGRPLVRGRLLADRDSTRAPPVVVVNEAAARRFFDRDDPLGKQIAFWGTRRTVVGIIGNENFHGSPTRRRSPSMRRWPRRRQRRRGGAAGAGGRRSGRRRCRRARRDPGASIRRWPCSASSRWPRR